MWTRSAWQFAVKLKGVRTDHWQHFLLQNSTTFSIHFASLRPEFGKAFEMDEDDVPDTRVFVSGLPPTFTSNQLGAHFAGRYQITDAVVVPDRRIGFVGFRNYTLAKSAIKYFDKTYIRMSKISVEMAKPVRIG
jgi:RNA recognition motif-containing protein